MNISSGQTFNHLTAISRMKGGHQKHAKWLCKCDCGKILPVRPYYLISGRRKHCGCLTREHRFYKKPYFHLYTTLRRMAKHRHKKCELTFEEFLTFTNKQTCHYCGTPLIWNRHSKDGISGPYNLDRMNPKKGYSVSNCVVCCGLCNYTKGDNFSYEEMVKIGKIVGEIVACRQINPSMSYRRRKLQRYENTKHSRGS